MLKLAMRWQPMDMRDFLFLELNSYLQIKGVYGREVI